MGREFDVVVYGATGFTGALLAEFFDQQAPQELSWAVAGRNADKLRSLAERLTNTPKILIADSSDEPALREMVKQTKVVATTVGPYAQYGSKLVQICAEEGTHYCDLAGEVPWIRRMIDAFDGMARSTGARLVHCCGFDSIPSDMGCQFLQEEFHRRYGKSANKVTYGLIAAKGGLSGGTAASLLNVFKEAAADPSVAELLADRCSLNLQERRWQVSSRNRSGSYDANFGWLAPFMMAPINTRIVRRSASLRPDLYGERFDYEEYMVTGMGASKALAAKFMHAGSNLAMASLQNKWGRALFNRILPKPGEGPDIAKRESGFFNIKLVGSNGPDKLSVTVQGSGDPGYSATVRMLGTAAMFLAQERWRPGSEAGNRTTADVFDRSFIEALGATDIKFTVAAVEDASDDS